MGVLTRPLAWALDPLWRRQIFQGDATRPVSVPDEVILVRDGVELRGWVVNPGRDRALLYFGGNGEHVEDNLEDFARWFPDRTVFVVAYRGYGGSGGRPTQRALTGDGEVIYDLACRRTPHEIDVMGRSLGSAVALHVATRRAVTRIVLVTPFDGLVRVAHDLVPRLPTWFPVSDRFDSAADAEWVSDPVLVMRATEDEVVRPARTAALVRALRDRSVDVEEVVVPGAGHNDLHLHPSYAAALQRFLA